MSNNKTVAIGKTNYEIEELSIERTLRLIDLFVSIADGLSKSTQDEFRDWLADYGITNQITITAEDLKTNEEAREAAKNIGIDPDKVNDDIVLPAQPSEAEIIGFFFPRIWKAARPQVLTIFALIIAKNIDLETAEDEEGGIDNYLKQLSKKIKHEGKLNDLINLSTIAFEVIKEEFERLRAEGNLPAPLQGLVSQQNFQDLSNDEQTQSTSSPATTAGPDAT